MNSRVGTSTKQEGKVVIRTSEASELFNFPSALPVGTLYIQYTAH